MRSERAEAAVPVTRCYNGLVQRERIDYAVNGRRLFSLSRLPFKARPTHGEHGWRKVSRQHPIGCNGIHYNLIFWYGYYYCKEIESLYDQPAARTCTKG
jgi:hypothetical protein